MPHSQKTKVSSHNNITGESGEEWGIFFKIRKRNFAQKQKISIYRIQNEEISNVHDQYSNIIC